MILVYSKKRNFENWRQTSIALNFQKSQEPFCNYLEFLDNQSLMNSSMLLLDRHFNTQRQKLQPPVNKKQPLFYQLFVVCFLVSGEPPLGGADGTEDVFGFCRTCVGCGPASRPNLKKALCRTCSVVGRRINKILCLLLAIAYHTGRLVSVQPIKAHEYFSEGRLNVCKNFFFAFEKTTWYSCRVVEKNCDHL